MIDLPNPPALVQKFTESERPKLITLNRPFKLEHERHSHDHAEGTAMRVFHVHTDLHRSDVRRAVAAEIARLGEIYEIGGAGFGVWFLHTDEPEAIIEGRLRRFLAANDTLTINRVRRADLAIPGIDHEWLAKRQLED